MPGAGRNAMVEGVEREALRFSVFCADRLVAQLYAVSGDKILDVVTGRGALAMAASRAVGPAGRVTVIDRPGGSVSLAVFATQVFQRSWVYGLNLHLVPNKIPRNHGGTG